MYVPNGSACTENNSQTPMDPSAITAQNWRVARVGRRFVRGNVALNDIVQTLGGIGIGDVPGATQLAAATDFRNAPACDTAILGDGSLYGGRVSQPGTTYTDPGSGDPVSMGGTVVGSDAGAAAPGATIPATPADVAAAVAAAASSPAAAGASGSGPSGAFDWWQNRRRPRVLCVPPNILPMMTVFPIPAAASSTAGAPVTSSPAAGPVARRAAPLKPARSPVSLPAAPAAVPTVAPTFPTTGNVCLDLMLNYVLQNQLSQTQIDNCALKGYSGIKNGPALTAAMIAWRNANYNALPHVADQPNVPPATPAMYRQYGFSGVSDGSGAGTALLMVLGGGVLLWAAVTATKGAR